MSGVLEFAPAPLAESAQVRISSIAAGDRKWLTGAERETYAQLRTAKRRADWLAGRAAAKQVVRARHASIFIEIASVTEGDDKGRPIYFVDGVAGPYSLSIAHSADVAVAALSCVRDQRIGIDIERVETRDASFEAVALSKEERAWMSLVDDHSRPELVTRIWVIKEALLKAVGIGLRFPLPQLSIARDSVERREGELHFASTSVPFRRLLGDSRALVSAFDPPGLAGAVVVLS